MTEDDARARIASDVSRETLDKIRLYEALLRKWQKKLNLVAPNTLSMLWTRHFLDSHQVFLAAPVTSGHWVDIGSGGGFPGLYCAIVSGDTRPNAVFELMESDTRKCAFLREVARQTDTPIQISNARVEAVEPRAADIISARALAPLTTLLPLVARHLSPHGTALLQKGANHAVELESVRGDWQMDVEIEPSLTAPESVVLHIRNLSHA